MAVSLRDMVSLEQAGRMAAELPGVTEGEHFRRRTWSVDGKGFAWERPFSKADIKRFGDRTPPGGPIFALRTADMVEKEAILATSSEAFFDIQHFSGYPGYLVQLDLVDEGELRDAIRDAWLSCAPEPLAKAYLNSNATELRHLRDA